MKTYDSLTNKLAKCYFRGSLEFSLKPQEVDLMTLEWQQQFLDLTVDSPLMKKHPVSNTFAKVFFKFLLSYLSNKEVHDGMYIHLCQAMESHCDNNFSYRHYIIGDDLCDVITIKETNKLVVDGTTGLRTWEAALVLADWAIFNREMFTGKKILELGSGVGFTGVALAKHCAPKSMYLTDCHPGVLKALCDNIRCNFPQMQEDPEEEDMYTNINKKIGALVLDWNAIESIPSYIVPDFIIGADIVYDPTTTKALCEVLKLFFERNPQMTAYIASVIRNEDTFEEFKFALRTMNLRYRKVPHNQSVFIDWKHNIEKCILKIFC